MTAPGCRARSRGTARAAPRIDGDVGFERRAVEQVPLRGPARRVADHPGPATDDRDRPAAEALQAEQPEDRHEVADVERRRRTGRSRCSRRSAGRSPGGPAGPGVVAWRIPRHSSSASSPPGPASAGGAPVTGSSVEVVSTSREAGKPFIHAPYAIVRPQMQTTLARRQRHRRALQRQPRGRAGSTVGRIVVVVLVVLLLTTGLARRAPVRSSPWAPTTTTPPACPTPVEALTNIDFEQQTIIYDRTGKIELARLGDLKRELVTFDQLPGEIIDATTAIEDKDFWTNPGFDPVGIVSAGLDTISGQAPRRIDDHPAARPRPAAPARGVRGLHVRAQDRARSSSRSG